MKSLYISDFYFYILSSYHLEITDFLHIFLPYFYRGRFLPRGPMSQ